MSPEEVLKKYWGYDSFRPMQREIIQSVLDGKDTLALLPTGGGKSICFQVPALTQPGVCLVISPLIALMKDQVYNLQKRNIPAIAIYSGMHYKEIDTAFDNCVYGNIKFLYLSPERLTSDLAIERIKKMNINLLAVDEAHCISQWGYDFRPPYLEIFNVREYLNNVPTLALTATATPEVVEDIQEKLNFKEKNVFQKSFSRDNLSYVVLEEEGKDNKLLDILKKVKGSGIVYVRNRKRTKDIAHFLKRKGIPADFYHAGLSSDIRSEKQDQWIQDKIRIMVSTNAFGMGIDKPDVRIVVHMDLPDSLEAYFQEAGRGGRDLKKSYAVLLYNDADRRNLERNYELAFPEFGEVKRVYQALGSYFQLAVGSGKGEFFDFDLADFITHFDLESFKTYNCLKILEKSGWISLTESVFIPSKIKIIVSKEILYDYQLKNKSYEKILKTILRSYQGVFNHLTPVNERKLARFLHMTPFALGNALNQIAQQGIIKYLPQKDKPQLSFLEERLNAEDLTFDRELYKFRKDRYRKQIAAAIHYARTPDCRSKMLLQYFGEDNDKKCGVCDVCLGRTKTELSQDEYENYKSKIKKMLAKEELSLEDIVESFASHRQPKVIQTLTFLVDNKIVERSNNKFSWKK